VGFNGYKDVFHGSKNGRNFSSRQGTADFKDYEYYFYIREVLKGIMALFFVI
jgi:hypothetical protein